MLWTRRENNKTENHEKRRLATLKRLKRGDDNELESNLVVASKQQTAQVGHGDGRRKKIKTGEDGSYRTAHVSPD